MILQTLAEYYERMVREGQFGVAESGFERKGIPFLLEIDTAGKCVAVHDTKDSSGKQPRSFILPKGVKKTSGIAANLLWDTPNYVLGLPKKGAEKTKKKDPVKLARQQKDQFRQNIKDVFPHDQIQDVGINAVLAFLARDSYPELVKHEAWSEIEEKGPLLTFKLVGETKTIAERETLVNWIRAKTAVDEGSAQRQTCLITGNQDMPVRLHTAIKGVWGGKPSGANIVSFNSEAFTSFAKEQGLNAPVGKRAEFAYSTALNTLLDRGLRQRLQVGDTSTVFWAERQNPLEDVFADLFGEPAKENPEQMSKAIRALYAGPQAGVPPLVEDLTRFYVLGLAPNAARIAIRFWHAGTVGQIARHIQQHFDDCAMVHGPNQPDHLSLFRLLICAAALGKPENIPPNVAGEMMKAILAGTPYPQTLLAAAVRRCRAEQEITYPRAAVIKAVLARFTRYYAPSTKEVGMALDPTNINIGYRLGRLFAVLEKIQEEANPGINTTIRDRFYGAASGTPVSAFPQLLKLKNHHLSKLKHRGRAVRLEKQLGEIMDGIQDFPAHLTMRDQGRFAVGYYHQRQEFFKKATKDSIQEKGSSLTNNTTITP